jgi:hypothetical protein
MNSLRNMGSALLYGTMSAIALSLIFLLQKVIRPFLASTK